jgi:hypothetical protein
LFDIFPLYSLWQAIFSTKVIEIQELPLKKIMKRIVVKGC